MASQVRLSWFHYLANWLLRLVFAIVLKLDIRGLDNVPPKGALIAAMNHTSFLDSVIALAYLRPDMLPIAKAEVFGFPFGWIFWGYGAFPVRRGEADLSALRRSIEILREGFALLISPEGTRTRTGALGKGHEGVALIAIRTGAPILPMASWGGKKIWYNAARLRRTPIQVRIGEPLALVLPDGKPGRDIHRAITDELMGYIARLLPPDYRGLYADAETMRPVYLRPMKEMQARAQIPIKEDAILRT